jgi:hypothetical protein
MSLFERLKPKAPTSNLCETCRGPLQRNHPEQVMQFCNPGCRRMRERKGRRKK